MKTLKVKFFTYVENLHDGDVVVRFYADKKDLVKVAALHADPNDLNTYMYGAPAVNLVRGKFHTVMNGWS